MFWSIHWFLDVIREEYWSMQKSYDLLVHCQRDRCKETFNYRPQSYHFRLSERLLGVENIVQRNDIASSFNTFCPWIFKMFKVEGWKEALPDSCLSWPLLFVQIATKKVLFFSEELKFCKCGKFATWLCFLFLCFFRVWEERKQDYLPI